MLQLDAQNSVLFLPSKSIFSVVISFTSKSKSFFDRIREFIGLLSRIENLRSDFGSSLPYLNLPTRLDAENKSNFPR